MKALIILFSFHLFAFAQDTELNKDVSFSFIYRQTEFKLVDEQGDLSLCKSIVQTGVSQIGDLLHFKIPQGGYKDRMYEEAKIKYPEFLIPDDLSNPYDEESFEKTKEIDGNRSHRILNSKIKKPTKVAPIIVKDFVEMMMQVILQESSQFPLTRGQVHRWAKGSRWRHQLECPLVIEAPKLLLMLATGVSYRFALTGKEDELAQQIRTYSVRSLYPHDVFRMSYRLNEGNLYLTLLTIENVFSRHWTAPKREAKAVTTRLAHITNDPENDNFGTWYHLFGTMLFGYSHGASISWSAGVVEGLGSGVASGFKAETQENKINLLGARIGGRLKRWMNRKKPLQDVISNESILDPKSYLNLVEFSE
jgi:hypothetical protein